MFACSGNDRAPQPMEFGLGAELTYPGCEHVEFKSCFVDELECQKRVFDAVTCVRGEPSARAPRIELVMQSDLPEILSAENGEPELEIDPLTRSALVQLGAIDDTVESRGPVELDIGGIAGLYLPESDRVILVQLEVEERWPVIAVVVLVHELTHYLQARRHDLRSIGVGVDEFDELLAAIAAVEGEASLYENVLGGVYVGRGHEQFVRESAVQGLTESADEIVAAVGTPMSLARGLFPYTHGFALAAHRWNAEGVRGVDTLLSSLPTTTREFLAPDEEGEREELVDVTLPEPPEGWALVSQQSLGAWVLQGIAGFAEGDPEAGRAAALAWRGDRFAAYSRGLVTAGVWRLAFSDDTVAAVVAQQLDGHATVGATLAAGANGSEVTVIAADPATRDDWLPLLP